MRMTSWHRFAAWIAFGTLFFLHTNVRLQTFFNVLTEPGHVALDRDRRLRRDHGYACLPFTYVARTCPGISSENSSHEVDGRTTKSAYFPSERLPRTGSRKQAWAADIVCLCGNEKTPLLVQTELCLKMIITGKTKEQRVNVQFTHQKIWKMYLGSLCVT
jgi:hypothetical protein